MHLQIQDDVSRLNSPDGDHAVQGDEITMCPDRDRQTLRWMITACDPCMKNNNNARKGGADIPDERTGPRMHRSLIR
ncbi:MAG: hypothetical protein KKE24_07435 [Candidatus Thermoplasmatota archaeon]|nr:hypothetical protein [Candidatus Thermoplasmatota archaeon]